MAKVGQERENHPAWTTDIAHTPSPQVAGKTRGDIERMGDLVTECKSGGSLAAGITPSGPVIPQQSPEKERNIGEIAR